MKERLLEFVERLRAEGLQPGPGEVMDALRAIAVTGIEREPMREALAACLVKDRADRAIFDALFDAYFAAPSALARRRNRRGGGAATGTGGHARPGGSGGAAPAVRVTPESEQSGRTTPAPLPERPEPDRGQAGRLAASERVGERAGEPAGARLWAARRALLSRPFRDALPDEIEDMERLLESLAPLWRTRWRRRIRRARRGPIDLRATVRRAGRNGGVPVDLVRRRRRPGRPSLLALVDVSHSTAAAARFLLSLIAPAEHWFHRPVLLAYVDHPVPIEVHAGRILPAGPIDLHARSDFGRVLQHLLETYGTALDRNTVLLILGDARNNRRPARADLLRRCRERVRAALWLNPEPPERWNTGDSVMAAYAPWLDAVLPAHNLRALLRATDRIVRP